MRGLRRGWFLAMMWPTIRRNASSLLAGLRGCQKAGLPGASGVAGNPATLIISLAAATPKAVNASLSAQGSVWARLSSRAYSRLPGKAPNHAGGSKWSDSRGYEHFKGRGGFDTDSNVWMRRVAILGGVSTVVYYTYREEIPYSHRKHMVLFSPDTSKAIGEVTFKQIIDDASKKKAVYPDNHPKTRLVRMIGMKLAETAAQGRGGGMFKHMKDCEWEFKVIHSPQINAFVVPGGKVVVYSGLLDILASQDELAFVLAHEISHVIARHSDERMTTASLLGIVKILFYMFFGFSVDGVLVLGLELPYSRRSETEADMIGLQLMAESCYDPRWAPGVHKKIHNSAPGSNMPSFLSTHPADAARIKALAKAVPEAMQAYSSAECDAKRSGFLAEFT